MRINLCCYSLSILLLFVFFSNSISGQVDIFTETFDEPNGSTSGMSAEGIPWSRVCPTCPNTGYYEVNNGAFENNNTDAPATWTTDPIDISNCSRIELSIDYSGDPFPGGGNLEANTECNMNGPCLGDVNNPNAGGCFNCWDFMDFNIYLDGVLSDVGLIGTINTPTATTLTFEVEDCPSVGSEAFLEVTCQTWAAAEYMRFDNVALVCFDDGGLTASLNGDGSICGDDCTTIDWNISGGAPPYTLDFTVTFGGIPIPFTIPGSPSTGMINVCLDPNVAIATFDNGANTLFVNPSFASLITISLDNVEDSNNCNVALSSSIAIDVANPPTINDIPDLEICTNDMGIATIDLTQFELAIGNGNTVNWFSDEALTMSIGPTFMTGVNTSIYATVEDGNGCISSDIEVEITLFLPPVLDEVADVFACDEYVIAAITGQNLNNPTYYSGPGQTGTIFFENQVINFNTTIYVYDENAICNAEISYEVNILPSPEIDPIFSVIECGYYVLEPITGDNVSPFAQYWTLPGGIGQSYSPGDTIFNSTVLYAFDLLGNCSDEVQITVLISQSPELENIDPLNSCGQVVLPPIEGDNLSGSEAYYTGPLGTGDIFSPGDTITNSQTLYIYDAIGNCTSEVTIEIEISQGPVLDVLPDVTVCDYYILPEITSSSGGQTVACYYNFEGQQQFEGDTIFTSQQNTDYICEVLDNLLCFAQLEFNIQVEENLSAGNDDTLTSCIGSSINLLNLLSQEAELGGEFIDIGATGAISNDTLDLNLVGGLTQVTFAYAVENICGTDTAFFVVNIEDFVDAGADNMNSVCDGTIVFLNDLIDGTPGGTFYDSNTGLPILDELTTDGEAGNTLNVIYVVGDGLTCERDSAVIQIEVTANPTFTTSGIVTSCDTFFLPSLNGTGIDSSASYYTEPEGQGIAISPGAAITQTTQVYLFFSNGFCAASDSLQINIGASSNTIINETICSDGFLDVNGTIYDISLPSGSQQLTGLYGCDSTLLINLSFFDIDTLQLAPELCFGQSIEVNGTIYDENNIFGTEILDNQAANGCDSIISVFLQFSNSNITPINEMICSNDSVLINGTYYSVNNPSGMDTIAAASGCDSILDIQLSFLFASTSQIDTTICSSNSIVINGTIYDTNNTSGTESIPGANQFGCDSIVEVNLSFYDVAQGFFTETFCPGDTVILFGVEFYEENPEQVVTLAGASAQNCDSSVLVSIDFYDVQEGLRLETICTGSTITIQGTEYSEMNPSGQFTVQNNDGCDSIVNVIVAFEAVTSELEIIDPICNEGESGYLVFNGLSSTSSDYSFSLDNQPFSSISINDTIYNILPGEHTLDITTAEGCISNNIFTIADPQSISVQLNDLVIIQEGETVQVDITVPADADIIWTPDIDISCTDCADPIFSPTSDITYYLTVTTPAGCIEMDTITIRVEQQTDVYIPNIFSPNDDGVNDVFSIFSSENIEYQLYVYDRWGNLMYSNKQLQSTESDTGWNGSYLGQPCKPSVYVYYAVLSIPSQDPNGEPETQILKGDITLIQ